MCSETLRNTKLELPRAGGDRTSLTLISSQLKGLMPSPARGRLYNRMGMMFLPDSSIPAEAKLGSLLLLQPPADHRPRDASPGPCWCPHWAGEGRRAPLLCLPCKPFTACGGVKHPCQKAGVRLPRVRREERAPFPFLPCSWWFIPPSLPAACLQKSSFILGNGGEIGARVGGRWNQTTS